MRRSRAQSENRTNNECISTDQNEKRNSRSPERICGCLNYSFHNNKYETNPGNEDQNAALNRNLNIGHREPMNRTEQQNNSDGNENPNLAGLGCCKCNPNSRTIKRRFSQQDYGDLSANPNKLKSAASADDVFNQCVHKIQKIQTALDFNVADPRSPNHQGQKTYTQTNENDLESSATLVVLLTSLTWAIYELLTIAFKGLLICWTIWKYHKRLGGVMLVVTAVPLLLMSNLDHWLALNFLGIQTAVTNCFSKWVSNASLNLYHLIKNLVWKLVFIYDLFFV